MQIKMLLLDVVYTKWVVNLTHDRFQMLFQLQLYINTNSNYQKLVSSKFTE